jgi:hypothetical protein
MSAVNEINENLPGKTRSLIKEFIPVSAGITESRQEHFA